ncbi:hypothetical protein ACFWDN_09845 [Micromonospora chalcea]
MRGDYFGPEFWERFFTSAGFGGVMAVVAAIIAGTIAMIQIKHARKQHRDARWWDTLTWVYDRTVVEDGKKAALPHGVTIAMLAALSDKATREGADRLQGEAVSSILTIFDARPEGVEEREESREDVEKSPASEKVVVPGLDASEAESGGGAPESEVGADSAAGSIKVTDPGALQMLEVLRRSLDRKGFGGGGIGGQAAMAGFNYEIRVRGALERIALEIGASFLRPEADFGVDFSLFRDGVALLVNVKYVRSRVSPTFASDMVKELVRQSGQFSGFPALLVTNRELVVGDEQRFREAAANMGVRYVVWRDSHNDEELKRALVEGLTARRR